MKIKTYLKNNNLTQAQLAELIGVSRPIVIAAMAGRYIHRNTAQRFVDGTNGAIRKEDMPFIKWVK